MDGHSTLHCEYVYIVKYQNQRKNKTLNILQFSGFIYYYIFIIFTAILRIKDPTKLYNPDIQCDHTQGNVP